MKHNPRNARKSQAPGACPIEDVPPVQPPAESGHPEEAPFSSAVQHASPGPPIRIAGGGGGVKTVTLSFKRPGSTAEIQSLHGRLAAAREAVLTGPLSEAVEEAKGRHAKAVESLDQARANVSQALDQHARLTEEEADAEAHAAAWAMVENAEAGVRQAERQESQLGASLTVARRKLELELPPAIDKELAALRKEWLDRHARVKAEIADVLTRLLREEAVCAALLPGLLQGSLAQRYKVIRAPQPQPRMNPHVQDDEAPAWPAYPQHVGSRVRGEQGVYGPT